MAKILQNTTASPVVLTDVGITVPASGNYTIPPTDYLLFAASSNTITQIGSGVLTVSDGSVTLSIASGTSLIQGLYPSEVLSDANQMNGSYPDPGGQVIGSPLGLNQDIFGNLQTRGTVLTDEVSFSDDFSAALATTLTGTITVVNGNATVNGTGTVFTTQVKEGQYIKISSQTEAQWTQIDYIVSDTQLILAKGYLGASAGPVAGQYSSWETTTASGTGSITVANSIVSLASGATNGQSCNIIKIGDYLPYTIAFLASITQHVANQTAIMGFVDAYPTPTQQAVVQFTGTNNTQVNFITSSSSNATDIQTTLVTLSSGTTATYHVYKIDISFNQATLSIDGVVVATNSTHLPGPYTNLNVICNIVNSAAVTTTTLAIDYIRFQDCNRIQIDDNFGGEPLPVAGTVAISGTVPVSGTVAVSSLPALPTGANTIGSVNQGTSPWVTQDSASNTSAATAATRGIQTMGVFSTTPTTLTDGQSGFLQLDSGERLLVTSAPVDGTKLSYSAGIVGLPAAAMATDIFTITGSATKTIRITRVTITGTQTTATQRDVVLLKRSTANTAGTFYIAPTKVPHDSGNSAATATVRSYTANPTLGTLVGNIRTRKVYVGLTTGNSDECIWDFGTRPAQAIVLRGTAEVLAVNLNSITSAGNSFDINIEWTEE